MQKSKVLVVDSGAIIKQTRLHEISPQLYTIPEVLAEIKDEKSRRYLDVIPFEIKTVAPSLESFKQVVEFAKKTGDFASLSRTDLRVLALTLDFEKKSGAQIRDEPLKLVVQVGATRPGPFTETPAETTTTTIAETDASHEDAEQEQENEEAYESEDDNDGWITPSNIKQIHQKSIGEIVEFSVACTTTDYAMQNVLLQMGMKVISVDGLRIDRIKTFVLRCHACFHITKHMEKRFCEKCGGPTLLKTTCSTDPSTGEVTLYLKQNFQYNLRGTKYTAPKAKGGREKNLIFREDQKEYQQVVKTEQRALNKMMKGNDQDNWGEFGSGLGRTVAEPVKIGFGRRNPNAIASRKR